MINQTGRVAVRKLLPPFTTDLPFAVNTSLIVIEISEHGNNGSIQKRLTYRPEQCEN